MGQRASSDEVDDQRGHQRDRRRDGLQRKVRDDLDDLQEYLRKYEHDACGLVAAVARDGRPQRAVLARVLDGLEALSHRAGMVDGEGDGAGVQVDIPRPLWARWLAEEAGLTPSLAYDRRFVVGHLFVMPAPGAGAAGQQRPDPAERGGVMDLVREVLAGQGFRVLHERVGATRSELLGARAREQEPLFWQVAMLAPAPEDAAVFSAQWALERQIPGVHVVSMSRHTAVYKVRGAPSVLRGYFPDLSAPALTTRAALGHTRYSTNTASSFDRVQPFGLLGHNGEINTIRRLREESALVGIDPTRDGSDSQDLNRLLEGLIGRYGFSLLEAMEIAFPPIVAELKQVAPELQDLYMYYRRAWGPFAQGPAGIIARFGDECLFATDALGLRPVWRVVTEDQLVFASEPGVVAVAEMEEDPHPLGPGEKNCVALTRDGARLLEYPEVQREALDRACRRSLNFAGHGRFIGYPLPGPLAQPQPSQPSEPAAASTAPAEIPSAEPPPERLLAAMGWDAEDLRMVREIAASGNEPVGSLGYDGPLAALSQERQNLADYFKETVAVVTNPAIDREREIEHFSTRTVLGPRPSLAGPPPSTGSPASPEPESGRETGLERTVELRVPLVVEGLSPGAGEAMAAAARAFDTLTWEGLLRHFGPACARLETVVEPSESLQDALRRLGREAVAAVEQGAGVVALDSGLAGPGDGASLPGSGSLPDRASLPIDPVLAVAAVDSALRPNLRRRASLVVRSPAVRHLHDLTVLLGMGADAVCPDAMFQLAAASGPQGVQNLMAGLHKGIEKVISTLGIHELRGYSRLFCAIGLRQELAEFLRIENRAGSDRAGLGWEQLEQEARRRAAVLRGEEEGRLGRTYHYYPKIWKAVEAVATAAPGGPSMAELSQRMQELEAENPVALRHLCDFAGVDSHSIDPRAVDTSVGIHRFPFLISSMSFGSQGEVAYRAYAEAAARLNIIAMNGEGGEIRDLVGRYPNNRGIQVASGRFGVHAEMLNGAYVIEIKIGQGAKPGEGGHLPGRKVSVKVAAARNARPGVDLISPSNNHDIYSIEDLEQLVYELHTINPRALVAVKVPVVPGIGTIAVGIAKAGADVVVLSGYDGGTGAARQHAIKHVGLPVEIGVAESHRALSASGLRDRVEIWADGGLKSAADVAKMLLLGADRCGFGTLAMVAVGCTICRGCQLDTCHVGIATQIESIAEARERGLKRFVPREFEAAVQRLCNLFEAMGAELQRIAASLGFTEVRQMVGRSDLLVQRRGLERVDLAELLRFVPYRASEVPRRAVEVSQSAVQVPNGTATGSYRVERVPHGEAGLPDAVAGVPNAAVTTLVTAAGAGGSTEGNGTAHANGTPYTNGTAHTNGTVHVHANEPVHTNGAVHRSGVARTNGAVHANGAPETNGSLAPNGSVPPAPAPVTVRNRAFATWAVGEAVRSAQEAPPVRVDGSTPGNGLAAFAGAGVRVLVRGAAQDGTAKCALGGRVVVLKGRNRHGKRVGGGVGKSFAYGAQRGLFLIQGDADSRAAIRLSGADVVFGAQPRAPVDDRGGCLAARANLKGFAFEYMTSGRAVVLGDPGPWICSGMTGGVVYLRLWPEMGLDKEALQRRLAKGARVRLERVGARGRLDLQELLGEYAAELEADGQESEAKAVRDLAAEPETHFLRVVPASEQTDPEISTE